MPFAIRSPVTLFPAGFAGLSTVSQTILQSFPMADSDAINGNFFRQQSSKIDEHRVGVKIDEHINDKHSVSGSIFTGGYSNSNNGNLNLLDSETSTAPTVQVRLQYNYVHSPTLINNVNIGFIRDTGFNGPLQPGPGLAALGLSGLPAFSPDSPYLNIGIGLVRRHRCIKCFL